MLSSQRFHTGEISRINYVLKTVIEIITNEKNSQHKEINVKYHIRTVRSTIDYIFRSCRLIWCIYPYSLRLAHWHCKHSTISPGSAKESWRKWDKSIYIWAKRNRTLHCRHNGRDGSSNHQPYDCLLNRLFRLRSKKYQSSASLAFVGGIHRWPVNSPHEWPVTRQIFPFDDVIMIIRKECT